MASLIKRGKSYYAQYCVAGKARRVALGTRSLQVAKEKVRQLESSLLRQDDIPIPTRTRLPGLLSEYVAHMKVSKTRRSVVSDTFYLREAFGPVCRELAQARTEGPRPAAPHPGRQYRGCHHGPRLDLHQRPARA